MAFKMKGSAFKLGNVATKSALKQAGDSEKARKKLMEEELAKLQSEKTIGYEDRAQDERDARRTAEDRYADKKAKEVRTEEGKYIPKSETGKSPMEQNLEQEQDLTTMSIEELKALSHKLIAEAEEKARNSMYWEDTGDDEYTKQDQKMLINEYTTNEDYNPDAAVLRQIVEIMKGKQESGEI